MGTILRCRLWRRCTIGQWKFISTAQVSKGPNLHYSVHKIELCTFNYSIFHHACTLVDSDDECENSFVDLLIIKNYIDMQYVNVILLNVILMASFRTNQHVPWHPSK